MNRTQKPWDLLTDQDPEVYRLIEDELARQREGLELIASENFASPAVIACMGSILTNKYAEGLPSKRYYGGCEVVDRLESLAIERVKTLFGAKYANVQPHSGAQANAAAFLALCKPGDKILGLDLSHGGHLTHGSKVNFSGIYYNSSFYGLSVESGQIDYDQLRDKALDIRPKLLIAGFSAYPRALNFEAFRSIADEVGAYLLVDMAHFAGLTAANLHANPLEYADIVTSTTHKTLRGPRGGIILWNDEALSKDINKSVFPGVQGGPLEHVIAAKAVAFQEAAQPSFKQYQLEVIRNAAFFAAELISKGFDLVTGGTDNHLVLLDLSRTPISGKQMEEALGQVAITVNKNTVPNEKRSPFVTSGVRFGTPAVTTRGMGRPEMAFIARWVHETFAHINSPKHLEGIRHEVLGLAHRFPLYSEWAGNY